MDSTKVLREAMSAYEAVYNQNLREELEEKRLVDELVPEIFETIAYALISQGHTAIDVLEYFSYVDEDVIIEDVIALSEGTLIVESVVSDEYIEEQFRQLDEVAPLVAAAARTLARPALSFAAKQAPKVAGAVTKLGQKAANAVWKSGSKATPMGRFPAGTPTAPGTKLLGQKNILQKAGGAISTAVGKVKDVARGALNKLPGGSKGKFAGALKTAANFAVPGLAFELGRASGGGGKGPATAKPKPGADKAKYNASAALGGKTAFQAGGGAAAMKANPKLTAADIQKKGTAALRSSAGGDLSKGAKLFKSKQEIMAGKSTSPSAPAPAPSTSSGSPSAGSGGSGGSGGSTSAAPTTSTTKPSTAKPSPSDTKLTPMQQWAKANPSLASKVKPGQSGYGEISSTREKPSVGGKQDQTPTQGPKTTPAQDKDFGKKRQSTTQYSTREGDGKLRKEPLWNSVDLFDIVRGHLLGEGYADTEEAALAIMANMSEEWRESIISGEQLQELSNRKLRAYVKKSEKSHQDLNKKWDQGTASYKDKYKSINRERGQERAFKTLDKRSGK